VDPLLLVRRVPDHRLAVTRRITAHWGTPVTTGVQWWELVDPVCDDEQPAAALAAVRPDGTTFRLVRLAAPPGRHDLAVQVLQGLVDALRASSAGRLAATLPPDGHDLLRRAGFRQFADAWAVDL
jgi:hypothetical protein